MSTKEAIENKISYIEERLKAIADRYKGATLEKLRQDPVLREAVERSLYVIAQAAIDLAEAMVAYRNLRKPTTMREAFDILVEDKILPEDFGSSFAKIVGFRNVLAHGYEEVDVAILHDVLQNKTDEIKEFIGLIKKAL